MTTEAKGLVALGLIRWSKFINRFVITNVIISYALIILAILGKLSGDKLLKAHWPMVITGMSLAVIAAIIMKRMDKRAMRQLLPVYGGFATDNFWRTWKYHCGDMGLGGFITAVIIAIICFKILCIIFPGV